MGIQRHVQYRGKLSGAVLKRLHSIILLIVVIIISCISADDIRDNSAFWAVLIAAIIGVISDGANWWYSTWELDDDAIILRKGFLNRSENKIPFSHIHSMNSSATAFQRLIGLVEVDIDTAAAKSEVGSGKLPCMKKDLADELIAVLSAEKESLEEQDSSSKDDIQQEDAIRRPVPPQTIAADKSLQKGGNNSVVDMTYVLSTKELFLVSLSRISLLSGILVLVGFGFMIYDFIGDLGLDQMAVVEDGLSQIDVAVLLSYGLLLIVLIISIILSFVKNLLSLGGYKVRLKKDYLTLETGLVNRVSQTVSVGRIQTMEVEQTVIARAMGYARVSCTVAGNAGGSDDSDLTDSGSVLLHPFIPLDKVDDFIDQFLPEYAQAYREDRTKFVPKRARGRVIRRALYPVCIIGGLLYLMVFFLCGFWGIDLIIRDAIQQILISATVIWAIVSEVGAFFSIKENSYGYTPSIFVAYIAKWRRKTIIIPKRNMQCIIAEQSIFQARKNLSDLSSATLGSVVSFNLEEVDRQDANRIVTWFLPK